jgi:hypothetical protein
MRRMRVLQTTWRSCSVGSLPWDVVWPTRAAESELADGRVARLCAARMGTCRCCC